MAAAAAGTAVTLIWKEETIKLWGSSFLHCSCFICVRVYVKLVLEHARRDATRSAGVRPSTSSGGGGTSQIWQNQRRRRGADGYWLKQAIATADLLFIYPLYSLLWFRGDKPKVFNHEPSDNREYIDLYICRIFHSRKIARIFFSRVLRIFTRLDLCGEEVVLNARLARILRVGGGRRGGPAAHTAGVVRRRRFSVQLFLL